MKNNTSTILSAAVSLFSAVAINTFLHPCAGMMKMKCDTTAHVATVVLALAAVISIASFFLKANAAKHVSNIISGVLGIALLFVPLLGSCGMADMRCNVYTMPAIRIAGTVLILIAAVAEALALRKRAAAA